MKYQDVLKRFVSEQAQLLQEKQMKQQMQEQRLAANAQSLSSFIPGQQQSPQEEYSETEHNPFEETQEYYDGGEMYGDPPKKNPYRTQVRASNNFNLANGNTNFNSSSMFIDDYDDGRVDPRTLEAIQPSADEYEGMKKGGEMIRRADGSYSRRGLWDNIRDNRGSGKKPTREMLEQERKIRREFATGGSFNNPGFNALPEAVQDKIIAAMMYGGNVDNNNWD